MHLRRSYPFSFALLLSLVSLLNPTACKTMRSDSAPRAEDESASVVLPVSGGSGKISVTQSEYDFVRELATSGKVFRNPLFWSFYVNHPELAKTLLEKFWFNSLPNEKRKILDAAYSLGEHFILYLDMGIAIRAEEFRDFAKAKLAVDPKISSFALRQAFAQSLPKAVVWRGVLLTPSEAEVIRTEGIKASGFYQNDAMRNGFLAGEYLQKTVFVNHPTSAYDDMSRRLGGMTGQSIYASYSNWIEVTYAGCWLPPLQGGGPLRSKAGIKFYLFKVEVSELDLVRPNGMLFQLIASNSQVYKTKGLDGAPWSKPFNDPAFEMFIQYVEPNEILEMRAYDELPPKWGT